MRNPRRNPDFRQRRPEAGIAIPVVLKLGTAYAAGGETIVPGTICSRLGKVNSAVPLAELSRCSFAGYELGAPVVASCTGIDYIGTAPEGEAFQLRFSGSKELGKGWKVEIPGDWQALRIGPGGFITGVLSDFSQQALFPTGLVAFSGDCLQPPPPPAVLEITNITRPDFDKIEVTFNTSGTGDLVANGIWPVNASSAGVPFAMTLPNSYTVQLQYMSGLNTGDVLTVAANRPELLSVGGAWAPPVFFILP